MAYICDRRLTDAEFAVLAAEINDSDALMSVYAAPEWAELGDDGKCWVVALVRETMARTVCDDMRQYVVGELTVNQVFRPTGIANLSDLQAVLNAVEAALVASAARSAMPGLSRLAIAVERLDKIAQSEGMAVLGRAGVADLHVVLKALRATIVAKDDVVAALDGLQQYEAEYRHAHDHFGDADLRAGHAWDRMRRAGDKARAVLQETPK